MVGFVNAKINIGLNIVSKRADGYHNLESVFYPVGVYNGTPENPEAFCDILEIVPAEGEDEFIYTGHKIDCTPEKNLVYRAVQAFRESAEERHKQLAVSHIQLRLNKHIPDGAGLGGGSADASFTLRIFNDLQGSPFTAEELAETARTLGADCPFFIENTPAYVTGIGEKIEPIEPVLDGRWAVIVKPPIYVSTREAFAGIIPTPTEQSLKELILLPVKDWEKAGIKNDFEKTLFNYHPKLAQLKNEIYDTGAEYASMSGSGSSVYGIYPGHEAALQAYDHLHRNSEKDRLVYLCKL